MLYRDKPFDEIFEDFVLPPKGSALQPEEAMDLAFSAALQGLGNVFSNPLVGAVCVDKDHRFVEAGWHKAYGKSHAEKDLVDKIFLQGLGKKLEGATVYSTLEPCSHIGKTPSCSHLLSQLPLKKVFYGRSDLSPKTFGKGPQILTDHGIFCEKLSVDESLKSKLSFLLETFESYELKKRPFVSVKVATTLNGVYAHTMSQREWISTERSRAYAHFLRLSHDAILVGSETVIQDNPSLTIRFPKTRRTPLRVVWDLKARALLSRPLQESNLLKKEASQTLWCLLKESYQNLSPLLQSQLKSLGVQFLFFDSIDYTESFFLILEKLYEMNYASLLIEGGAKVWGEALNSGLTDKLSLFQAPKIFCRDNSLHWTKEAKINNLDLKKCTMTSLGKDLLIEGLTH